MPEFDVKTPDGGIIHVVAPEGATEADAIAYAKNSSAAAPTASKKNYFARDPILGSWTEPLDNLGQMFLQGLVKGGAGAATLALDTAGAVGVDRASKMADSLTATMNQGRKSTGVGESIAEGAGEVAPALLLRAPGMLASGLIGAGTGLMSFQPGATSEERWEGRGLGAGIGGVAGLGLGAIGNLASKIFNSRGINKTFQQAQKDFGDLDPTLAPARGTINAQMDRLNKAYASRGDQAIRAADNIGPMNLQPIEERLRSAATSTKGMVDPDPHSAKILDKIVKELVPEQSLPPSLTVGGRKFSLDPSNGNYLDPSGTPLPPNVVQQVIGAMGHNTSPDIRYSKMKEILEEVDNYLETTKTGGNVATKTLADVRKILGGAADSHLTPDAKRLARRTESFYEKNLEKFNRPEIKGLLTETNELNRANIAIDAAVSGTPEVNKTIAELIGAKGREAVGQGLIKKALDQALDMENGQIDAVKFAKFFEGRSVKPYFEGQAKELVGGVRNLLNESALRHGSSPSPSLSRPAGIFGLGYPLFELAQGHVGRAAAAATAAALAAPSMNWINRALTDRMGRNLLVAASRAKEGSTQMTRITQTLLKRFGPVAAGQQGAELGAEP